MFNELEKRVITISLMYFLNDYTEEDLNDCEQVVHSLNYDPVAARESLDKTIEELIESFVGPTWDEETTTKNIKRETEKRSR